MSPSTVVSTEKVTAPAMYVLHGKKMTKKMDINSSKYPRSNNGSFRKQQRELKACGKKIEPKSLPTQPGL